MAKGFVRRIVRPALMAGVFLSLAQPAFAQLSRVGGPISIPMPVAAQARIPDTAFDRQDNAYLVVTGGTPIKGAFLSQDGIPYDQYGFAVTSTDCGTVPPCSWQWSMMPRAAYGEGGIFLVVWLDTRRVVAGVPNGSVADIYGRLVQYGVGPIGPDFEIGRCDFGAQSESPASVAYSPTNHEFLVAWTQLKKGVRVRRVSISGGLLSGDIVLTGDPTTGLDPDGPMQASVGYDAAANNYFVAWSAYNYTANYAYIAGVRVQSGADTVLGTPVVLKAGVYATIPQVTYNPAASQYLVFWYERGGAPGSIFYARAIGGDGSLPGDVVPVTTYAAYDALGVDYNTTSGTYVIATHDGATVEDLAIEVTGAGMASPPIVATANGGTGNFNPRVAAHATRPQWLLVTSKNFQRAVGQLLQSGGVTGPPPGPSPYSFSSPGTIEVQPNGTLTITGAGFGASQGSAVVQLGGVTLPVQSWSDTQIVLLIPGNAPSGHLTVIANGATYTGPLIVVRRLAARCCDLDGDGRADVTVFRPSTGVWWGNYSTTGYTYQARYLMVPWGIAGDIPVPGDYDGDGKVDIAIWRPSTGDWWILKSSDNYSYASYIYVQWGSAGDIPVPGDYDGDGKTDLAVWRPSTGEWWILQSSDNYSYKSYMYKQWGATGDVPVPGDYDGDGKTDLAVWRPSTGEWWMLKSSAGYSYASFMYVPWGLATDVAVPADYDGDGKTDLAVWRPSTGEWWILKSSSGYSYGAYIWASWGWPGDIPVPADYDGDGKADLAVFRPSTGTWWGLWSTNGYVWQAGYLQVGWGWPGDVPIKH